MKKNQIFLSFFFPLICLFLFLQVFSSPIQAKPQLIDVGGTIAADTIWTVANSPYILTDTVTVQAGVTLTIEAGVTVQTPNMGEYLDVQGHLEAVGTAVNPIIFTSIDDLPANNWSGITVSGSANFEHVTLRHAYTALFISNSSGGTVSLTNSMLDANLVHPIVVDTDALHRLSMNNVTFSNNVPNRVGINKVNGMVDNLTLAGNVILTAQDGLEGYEDLGNGSTSLLIVPQGITLTFGSGTTFMSDSSVIVDGHLVANGTALESVILDDRPEGGDSMFNYFVVGGTGSANLTHTIIRDGNPLGLGIGGQSDLPIILQDVILDNVGEFPIIVEAPSLHRLQMTNVTFQNNTFNRVMVDTDGGQDAIAADVTLTAQPGLEWYEFADGSTPQTPPAQFVVPEGMTLTVKSGVELRFGDGAEEFVVNGRFITRGTLSQPITLTSGSNAAAGDWLGLLAHGELDLENTAVRLGSNNLIISSTAEAFLKNVTLTQAEFAGLQVAGGAVTAVRSQFSQNGTDGILVANYGTPDVTIENSGITGNGDAGLRNLSSTPVEAQSNWWGDETGPAGAGSGNGDGVLGNVNYADWLPDERWTMLHYQLYLPSIILLP